MCFIIHISTKYCDSVYCDSAYNVNIQDMVVVGRIQLLRTSIKRFPSVLQRHLMVCSDAALHQRHENKYHENGNKSGEKWWKCNNELYQL